MNVDKMMRIAITAFFVAVLIAQFAAVIAIDAGRTAPNLRHETPLAVFADGREY